MSEVSAILALPYLQPAQAQKHVTHNEALRRLDVLVQLTVFDRDRETPPAAPAEGARHIVGPGASGVWAGHSGEIAVFLDGVWDFVIPQPGWQSSVLDEGTALVWTGTDWTAPLADLPLLGINTTADATNRLAVAAPATLLSHAGAGHQLKVNKAAVGDTGSLMFQTGFSGRAEIGLAGSDDFSVKVSADGSAWVTALTARAADGRISQPAGLSVGAGTAALPGLTFDGDPDTGLTSPAADQIGLSAGGVQRALLSTTTLQVNLPLTGTAVTQSVADTTAGRLMKVGDFGLGVSQGATSNDANLTITPSLNRRLTISGLNMPVVNAFGWSLHTFAGSSDGSRLQQIALSNSDGRLWSRASLDAGATWTAWNASYGRLNILGAVTQSAGVPTGALIERGTSANGEFTRLADGTLICRKTLTASAAADTTWTFPSAFVTATDLYVDAAATTGLDAMFGQCRVPSTTAVAFNIWNTGGARQALSARLIAIGRWF